MYCFFLYPYLPIGKCWQNSIIKYPQCPKTLTKQEVPLIVKTFKKLPNQLASIGRQTLPPLPILHSEL